MVAAWMKIAILGLKALQASKKRRPQAKASSQSIKMPRLPTCSPGLGNFARGSEDLLIEQGDTVNFQPAKSPVWDTAITAFALGEKGAVDQQITTKAADWLLQKEVRRFGTGSAPASVLNQQLPRVTSPKRARSEPLAKCTAHGAVTSNLA
jgi:hypothetical protein